MIKKLFITCILGYILSSCSPYPTPIGSEPSSRTGSIHTEVTYPTTQTGITYSGKTYHTGEEIETEIALTGSNTSGSSAIDETLHEVDTILNR